MKKSVNLKHSIDKPYAESFHMTETRKASKV